MFPKLPEGLIPRRQTLVHRKQRSFAFKILVAQLITILVYQAAMQVRLMHYLKRSTTIENWEVVSKIMSESFITLLITGSVTGVLLFMLGLWQSHRMLGPVPRLQAALRQVAAGDTSVRLKFRPGDYLEELADDFNAAVEAIDTRRAVEDEKPDAPRAA